MNRICLCISSEDTVCPEQTVSAVWLIPTSPVSHLDSNSAFEFSNTPLRSPHSTFVATWEKWEEGNLNNTEGKGTKRVTIWRRLEFITCFCLQNFYFHIEHLWEKSTFLKFSGQRSKLVRPLILWVISCSCDFSACGGGGLWPYSLSWVPFSSMSINFFF